MDGTNLKQVTGGKTDSVPTVSPDDQWVVFTSGQEAKSVLMRVPSVGGPASKLTDYPVSSPSISPDGNWIACEYFTPNQSASLAIVPFTGGQPARVFPQTVEILAPIRWTPDGLAISFLNSMNGATNVWEQPVAGGALKRMTDFPSGDVLCRPTRC